MTIGASSKITKISWLIKNKSAVAHCALLEKSRLYSQNLASHGISSISPEIDSELQQLIIRAVYNPKWGINATYALVSKQAMSILETANNWLLDTGAEIVIAGCTELSVGFASMATVALPWVDPLDD